MMRRGPIVLLQIATLVTLSGCLQTRHSYAPTDAFFGSGQFPVPSEFRRGRATRFDIDAWSQSLLGTNSLESVRVAVEADQPGWLFVSQPAHRGTGGNFHLIFREGRHGFTYLGNLFFGSIRWIPPDRQGKPRLLTSSWMGGGECRISIEVLQPDGFHSAATRVLPCGDSATDENGGRLERLLFDSDAVPLDTLEQVFGADF